jgi:hypothetical protein
MENCVTSMGKPSTGAQRIGKVPGRASRTVFRELTSAERGLINGN